MYVKMLAGIQAAVFALGLSGGSVQACSTPVYRYALERWEPDLYEVRVFHKGPLAPAVKKAVDELQNKAPQGVNVYVKLSDMADAPAEAAKGADAWLTVTAPARAEKLPCVWSKPLTARSLRAVLDSPKRREIARRILADDCAVWVLLESGRKAQDDAAAKLLAEQLKRATELVRMSVPPGGWGEDENLPPPKPKFTVVRLARSDPSEQAFVQMLLATEPDLKDLTEPMALPMFGRGRALFALVGKGINAENVIETCAMLVGACSCEFKAATPGMDVLMSVNWNELVAGFQTVDEALPPLRGFSEFAAAPATRAAATQAAATQPVEPIATADQPKAVPPGAAATYNLWLVLGVLVAAVLVGSIVLNRIGRGDRG